MPELEQHVNDCYQLMRSGKFIQLDRYLDRFLRAVEHAGMMLLHSAIKSRNNQALCLFLMHKGIDAMHSSFSPLNALEYAAYKHNYQAIIILLLLRPDSINVNALSQFYVNDDRMRIIKGFTAIMIALLELDPSQHDPQDLERTVCALQLMAPHVDLRIKDTHGYSVFDYASGKIRAMLFEGKVNYQLKLEMENTIHSLQLEIIHTCQLKRRAIPFNNKHNNKETLLRALQAEYFSIQSIFDNRIDMILRNESELRNQLMVDSEEEMQRITTAVEENHVLTKALINLKFNEKNKLMSKLEIMNQCVQRQMKKLTHYSFEPSRDDIPFIAQLKNLIMNRIEGMTSLTEKLFFEAFETEIKQLSHHYFKSGTPEQLILDDALMILFFPIGNVVGASKKPSFFQAGQCLPKASGASLFNSFK